MVTFYAAATVAPFDDRQCPASDSDPQRHESYEPSPLWIGMMQ